MVRLNSEDAIQMVTALVLQLIQCVVVLPTEKEREKPNEDEYDDVDAPVVDSVSLMSLYFLVFFSLLVLSCTICTFALQNGMSVVL